MNRQDLNKKLNELELAAREEREFIIEHHPELMAKDCCYPVTVAEFPWERIPLLEFKDFMIVKLSFALLKAQILQELYTYRSAGWMLRLKTPDNQYAANCVVVDVDLLNGCKKAEVIIFGGSAEGKKIVENELSTILNGRTLQELLYEYIDSHAESLSQKVDSDEYVKFLKEEQSK